MAVKSVVTSCNASFLLSSIPRAEDLLLRTFSRSNFSCSKISRKNTIFKGQCAGRSALSN